MLLSPVLELLVLGLDETVARIYQDFINVVAESLDQVAVSHERAHVENFVQQFFVLGLCLCLFDALGGVLVVELALDLLLFQIFHLLHEPLVLLLDARETAHESKR